MKKLFYRTVFVGVMLFLTACGTMSSKNDRVYDRDLKYLQSENGVDLVVPADLSNKSISRYFHIPEVSAGAVPVPMVPPGSEAYALQAKN